MGRFFTIDVDEETRSEKALRSWNPRGTILRSNNEFKFENVKTIIKALLHQTSGFGLMPNSRMAQMHGPGNTVFLGELIIRWNLNCSEIHENRE